MESTAPGRAGEAVQDGGRSQTEKEKERLHAKETGLAAILKKAVNYVHLYEKEEGGRRRYRGHLLITNKGNKNLLGPKFAELDEEGDGYYLTGRRHFYLKEANEAIRKYMECDQVREWTDKHRDKVEHFRQQAREYRIRKTRAGCIPKKPDWAKF